MNIANATAFVTGSNRGLGRAFVQALLDRGARRVYAASRVVDAARDLCALDPERVVPIALDVTEPAQASAAAAAAGDVDLLINNAGVLAAASQLTDDIEIIHRLFAVNYFGTLNVVRAFAPILAAAPGGGAIANILSISSLVAMKGFAGYSASKFAAWALTQALRAELAPSGVSVHAAFPGAIDTDMLRGVDVFKNSPRAIADAILDGVAAGDEDILPDDMAREIWDGLRTDRKIIERQFNAL